MSFLTLYVDDLVTLKGELPYFLRYRRVISGDPELVSNYRWINVGHVFMRTNEEIFVVNYEGNELLPVIRVEPRTNQDCMVEVRGVDRHFIKFLHQGFDISRSLFGDR